jgi:glycosyltransferase involved in cell wall biosynthesis
LSREASFFDLIHIHELWHHAHFVAYRAAVRNKIPYVITIHGALENWALNYKAIKKRFYMWAIQAHILKKARGLHVFTDEEARNLKRFKNYNHVVVIPNGVNLAEFSGLPSKQHFEIVHPELKGKKVLLFLGRIHPIKGLDILAKAFGGLVRERGTDEVSLLIAGPDEGGYRSIVESVLKSEGCLGSTIFAGVLDGKDKLAALARADVLVQPSYSEGFSTSILEGLACGIPVLVTSKCNFPEIQEMGAGKVIEPDADKLLTALKNMLSDSHMLKKMGENGKRLVSEKYDWDMIAVKMIDFYEEIWK